MANDCLDKTGGNHPKARPRLFAIEIQSDQDEVTIQEEVEHDNEGPTVENPQEEIEGDESPIEQENNEEQILYVEDNCELDDDDEPVAYLGAMRKDEESSEDEHIVRCAMMHGEPDLPELEENPPQEDWNWSCQYGALHTGDCEECSCRVRHVGQALHRTSPSLNRAIDLPKRYAEQEFQQGVDIGTRTCQEPSGSVDECLHVASHMMAYHLRVIEGERLDLLMKTMVVHSAARRTGHQNDDLEESIKALLTELRDQRERHAGLQINQHKVEIQT